MPRKERKKNKKRATGKKCPASPTKTDSTSDTTVESINDPIQCLKLPPASILSVEADSTSKKIVETDPLLCSKLPAVNTSTAEASTTFDITVKNGNDATTSLKLQTTSILSGEASTSVDITSTTNQYQQPIQPVPSINDPALSSKLPTGNISPTKAIVSSDTSIMCVTDTTLCPNFPLENISFDVSLDTTVTNIDDSTTCSKYSTENVTCTEISTNPNVKKVDDADLFSKSLTESTLSADISTCSNTTVKNVDDSTTCSEFSTENVTCSETSTSPNVKKVDDADLFSKSLTESTLSADISTCSDTTVKNIDDSTTCPKFSTENVTCTETSTSPNVKKVDDADQFSKSLTESTLSADISTCSDTTVKNIDDSTTCSKFSTENVTCTETSTSPNVKKVDDADQFSKSLTESTLSGDISTYSDTTIKNVDDSTACSKFSTEDITSIDVSTPSGTVVKNVFDPVLYSKFVNVKNSVPDIFLHQPANLAQHIQELSSMGINFKQPYRNIYYTKIKCPTYDDKKAITQYFEKKKLPYHTFCDPFKRKLKVIIRGFPKDIDLFEIKSELKSVNIPIIRVHKMKLKKLETEDNNTSLILAVVPCSDEGIKLLRVEKILGHRIKLETPKPKTKQCHRCQLWGHTQRYCHGQVKCVKCAGDHLSKKCMRDASKEPPKCANCGGKHTANYRQCPCCPDSSRHQKTQKIKHNRMQVLYRRRDCDTLENCDNL